MNTPFDLRPRWNTAWHGLDIAVLRNDVEIDRLHAPDVRRIVFAQPSHSTNAGALRFALVELDEEFMLLPAETGFAGRVHFERQAFWAAKTCIYWVDAAQARLPARCLGRRGLSLVRRSPCFGRLPRAELAPIVERWPLEGPHSWDERRWQHIERSRPFARLDTQPSSHSVSRLDTR
ncbi:MAG: hypothetical protein V4750_00130 [Pseudomonadota bacterium]